MIIIRLSVERGVSLLSAPWGRLLQSGHIAEEAGMAKIERYDGKYLVAQIEDWLSDIRSDKHNFAFEMSNTSMRMQSEFWLLAQAFMLEMAKYHDPELGPNKNNRVALECAVIKKLMDDTFGQ
jgi:hypothetical protein